MITELFLNEQYTDLSEEEQILLTMAVADVKEPESKSSTFSKTVRIPGTKGNNKIFKQIFEITNDNQFNPNAKSSALMLQGGIEVLEGYAQLLRINKLHDDRIEYQVQLFSNTQSLFTDMGDNLMTGNTDSDNNLDLSHLNHTYTRANQITSWTAPIGEGYVYPLIDYGYTPNSVLYDSTHLYPCVYLKELVDVIFEKYGYRYNSAFMETDYFKRLVVPYSRATAPPLSTSGLAAKESIGWINPNPYELQANPTAVFTVPFDEDYSDPGGNFNIATYTFTCPATAPYIISGILNAKVRFVASAIASGTVNCTYQVDVLKNGVIIASSSRSYGNLVSLAAAGQEIFTEEYPYEVITFLTTGDTINVRVTATYSPTVTNIDCYAGTEEFSYVSCKRQYQNITAGDNFPGNYMLPINIKQREFLSSVLKKFNLYVDQDKDNTGYLLIEPRDDYYNLGTVRNWTDKLDRSQEVEILPMSELDFKEIVFKDKEDGDYWNKLYKDEYSEPYGTQRAFMNTDFVKDVKVVDTIFSPTPLVNQLSLFSPVVPAIYSMDTSGVKKLMNTNPRLLYYAGLKDKNWTYTEASASSSGFTYYPYAGHLDDPYSATLDIDWGAPKKIYYFSSFPISLTNNTLYGGFYRNYLAEITNINSKLMTAYFDLSPLDIATLRMYDTIYVDGAYWRINKIIDYNATGNDLTKVELLFQIDTPLFEPTQTVIDGSGGDEGGEGEAPGIDGNMTELMPYGVSYTGEPTSNDQKRLLLGESYPSNEASNLLVLGGEGNVIGGGCEGVEITGCTNCIVGPNCTNISLKNCSDITIPEGSTGIICMNCDSIAEFTDNSVYINDALV